MTSSSGAGGLDQVMADTRRALAAVRGRAAAEDAAPAEGVGTARDEQVRVVVRAPGRVTALELNPRVLRLPAEDLAAEIMTAVNAALEELRGKVAATAVPADLDELRGQLEELHYESVRQLERFMSGISGAVEHIRARKG